MNNVPQPLARSTPAGTRIYAIGDIHGRLDLLRELHRKIDEDMVLQPVPDAVEIYLGDYVDRGPDSKGVLDCLAERRLHRDTKFILGNHEWAMISFLHDPDTFPEWRRIGGLQTLLSFGLEPSLRSSPELNRTLASALRSRLSDDIVRMLCGLQAFCDYGDYVFVHAGLRPGVPMDKQLLEDLLTIRQEFLRYSGRHEKVVVHGHTPVPTPEVRANRINLDTGAFATGRLTCARLQDQSITLLQTAPGAPGKQRFAAQASPI